MQSRRPAPAAKAEWTSTVRVALLPLGAQVGWDNHTGAPKHYKMLASRLRVFSLALLKLLGRCLARKTTVQLMKRDDPSKPGPSDRGSTIASDPATLYFSCPATCPWMPQGKPQADPQDQRLPSLFTGRLEGSIGPTCGTESHPLNYVNGFISQNFHFGFCKSATMF